MSHLLPTLCALAGVAAIPALTLGGVAAGRAILRPSLVRRLQQRSRGSIVLTFDDGPSRRFHEKLLGILERRDARATFYLLESRVEGNVDQVERLLDGGHEIGTHSFGHLDAYSVPPEVAVADFMHGLEVCRASGRPVRRFRPPCGSVTVANYLAARRKGLSVDLWTVDSGDTYEAMPDVASVVDQVARDNGGVVLLHSHERSDRPDAAAQTLAVTEALLELSRRRSLPIRRMCDIAA